MVRPLAGTARLSTSVFFVLAVMVLAGLAEYLYRFHLAPRGALEMPLFRGLLGLWFLVIAGAVAFYRRVLYELLASVRTSAVILAAFTLACIAGSFVLQDRDLESRNLEGPAAYRAFRLAQAGFVHGVMHGSQLEAPLDETDEEYFRILAERHGEKYAAERRSMFRKMKGSRILDARVEVFAQEHDAAFRRLWRFCQATRLSDTYRSWWFGSLMVLLALSLACASHKRWAWRFDQAGSQATHIGFLLLMLGFALSTAYEERGMLPLQIGRTMDAFWEFNDGVKMRLPFRVHLQDFHTAHRHELFVDFGDLDARTAGYPGSFERALKADPGRRYSFWEDRYEVEVVEAAEYGQSGVRVVDRPDGPQNPVVTIGIRHPSGQRSNGWLFARDRAQSVYDDPGGRYLLSFHWGDDPDVEVPPTQGDWGTLELRLADGSVAPLQVPVRVGERFEFAGREIEIAQVAADFQDQGTPADQQLARNPAVLLRIQGEGDEEPRERWNFAWLDFDALHTPPHPDIRLTYRFRPGAEEPERVFRLHGEEDGGLDLVYFDDAAKVLRTPIEVGSTVPLADGIQLAVEELMLHGALEHPVTPLFERALQASERLAKEKRSSGSGAVEVAEPEDPRTGLDRAGHDHAGHDHVARGLAGDVGGRTWQPSPVSGAPLPPLPPEVARKFAPPGPPSVKLRIRHPGGTVERWFLSGDSQAGAWTDGKLRVVFGANRNKVKEWRSLLVADDGEEPVRQMVRVNHPLEYRGWTMYQTDAKQDDPTYSGIQVLYDPGWYLIEPGLVLVCLGVIFMFWVKPWLRMDQSGGSAPITKGVEIP